MFIYVYLILAAPLTIIPLLLLTCAFIGLHYICPNHLNWFVLQLFMAALIFYSLSQHIATYPPLAFLDEIRKCKTGCSKHMKTTTTSFTTFRNKLRQQPTLQLHVLQLGSHNSQIKSWLSDHNIYQ